MEKEIKTFEEKVKELMSGEATGHDWYHVKQVRDMSLRIAEKEGGDTQIVELAALAHDVGDRKFHPSEEAGELKTRKLLEEAGINAENIERVMNIVHHI